MSNTVYYILCLVLSAGVLVGISLMAKPKSAVSGNTLSAVCVAAAILITLYRNGILSGAILWACMGVGLVIGLIWALRVKMIEMPQTVALFNGFGGAASALVAMIFLISGEGGGFEIITAALAVAVGIVTLVGSIVAAGKLNGVLNQKPYRIKHFALIFILVLAATAILAILLVPVYAVVIILTVASGLYGAAFSLRVGGADMPVTVSLLNALSGVAGSIVGMSAGDPLLVAVGGIVGASGLLLTQIMCRAMNRSLYTILTGGTTTAVKQPETSKVPGPASIRPVSAEVAPAAAETAAAALPADYVKQAAELLKDSRFVIIVPGYGMALSQAQESVKKLADLLEKGGASVLYAIHPVAGRMPGHMNVLLAEVDVDYEKLVEMDDINGRFSECGAALVVGANDIVNPAARYKEDTPLYGMPVLAVDEASRVIICNYDRKPGYSGVDNPLYAEGKVIFIEGDAAASLNAVIEEMKSAGRG